MDSAVDRRLAYGRLSARRYGQAAYRQVRARLHDRPTRRRRHPEPRSARMPRSIRDAPSSRFSMTASPEARAERGALTWSHAPATPPSSERPAQGQRNPEAKLLEDRLRPVLGRPSLGDPGQARRKDRWTRVPRARTMYWIMGTLLPVRASPHSILPSLAVRRASPRSHRSCPCRWCTERCALRGSRRVWPGRSGCHGGPRDPDTVRFRRSDGIQRLLSISLRRLPTHRSARHPMAPTSRVMASSLGKMPTTLVRRLTSAWSRSIGLVECNFWRCSLGKLM